MDGFEAKKLAVIQLLFFLRQSNAIYTICIFLRCAKKIDESSNQKCLFMNSKG